jgi:hypothetical protein
VTSEDYRWVSDARWHPDGDTIVATKWYSHRSIPGGEGWQYSVPCGGNFTNQQGHRLVGRTLPYGWGITDYANIAVGPEQFVWKGHDSLIYSKNVIDETFFEYSKGKCNFNFLRVVLTDCADVHKGIYAIFLHNLTTGVTETLVDASPGGATRPELSRDQRTLAFVRRVRDKEALVLK